MNFYTQNDFLNKIKTWSWLRIEVAQLSFTPRFCNKNQQSDSFQLETSLYLISLPLSASLSVPKMFSSGPNYNKLKTNLRLSVNRLKLLEKKKTETNLKSRKEIAGKLKFLDIPGNILTNLCLQTFWPLINLTEPEFESNQSFAKT